GGRRSIQLSYGRLDRTLSYNGRPEGRLRFSILATVALAIVCAGARVAIGVAAIAPDEFAARRAAVAHAIGRDSVLVAFSAAPARRTGDIDWPLRQEDNLLYLTGMNV